MAMQSWPARPTSSNLEACVIQIFASAKSQIIIGQEPSAKAEWMMFMNVNLERKASSR